MREIGRLCAMATMADLDELALALPGRRGGVGRTDGPRTSVHGKAFVFHRCQRKDAVDAATGERLDDVLMFRVADLDEKEILLSDDRGIYFTTPHFNGYPAVLVRIPDLARLDRDELDDLARRGLADAGAEARREGLARRARSATASVRGDERRRRLAARPRLRRRCSRCRSADAAAAAPPRPQIVAKPIPFPAKRKLEMQAYAKRHYGARHVAAAQPEGDRRARHRLEHVRLGVLDLQRRRRPTPSCTSCPARARTS